ncbi:MipA/OmpV family protein [Methylovirgula sp. 4M-Z18]|nr:MipA/OmpV family protein [Methylovirgula sp. 4M-Z18]
MVLALACFALIGAARAADLPTEASQQKPQAPDVLTNGWIITIGAMAEYEPRYEGARVYGPTGYPSFSFRRSNEPREFSAPDDNMDYALIDTPTFKAGPVASIDGGRYVSTIDARLRGLDNYPWTVQGGVFLEYWFVPEQWRARVELRHGLHAADGFVVDLGSDYVQPWNKFTFSGGPRLSLADQKEMNLAFGVSNVAAQRNPYVTPFRADGGVKSVGLSTAVSYDWTDAWRTTLYQRYDRLVSDAATSPITHRLGSRNQFTLGLGFDYSFGAF